MDEDIGSSIGQRLREVRAWRGLSLRAAAGLAGFSAAYLSMIENEKSPVDKRSTLEALATALRVSPGELTGQPYRLARPDDVQVRAEVAGLEVALTEPALEPHWRPDGRPWRQLAGDLAKLNTVHRPAADYITQARLLPGLLDGLRGALADSPGQRRAVLYGLLDAYHAAEELTKSLGVPGLPHLAVLHAQRVAEELDDPAALGLAAWLRAIVLGGAGRERVLDLCGRAIDGLGGKLGDPSAAQMVGELHLCSALANAALHRGGDAAAHLAEAQRLAELQPENAPDFGLVYFSPDNVGIWRVSIAVELGEFGRAREVARGVVLDHVPSAARQAVYWSDLGRGMAADRSSPEDAVRALRRAEDISPHTVRNNPFVRETVTDLLRRTRRDDAVGRELRGLAYRMGIAG